MSYLPDYKRTNKKRMSYVYRVEFPHILEELEVKTDQFLGGELYFIRAGGNYTLYFHRFSPSLSVSHNIRPVFIFSVASLA